MQILPDVIWWPSTEERKRISDWILLEHGIPQIVGFVDGCHINMDRAPYRGVKAGAFHSRKERYRFNVVAAVDHAKRFTYMHSGSSARSSDMRIQRAVASARARHILLRWGGLTRRLWLQVHHLPHPHVQAYPGSQYNGRKEGA